MSTKNQIKKKTGFTIIEVVLVLAIAGLIFLMVFVALPSLQKSQKDTQRRSDMARVSTAMTQYLTNNRKLPGDADEATFIEGYLGGNDFKDPDGELYSIDFLQVGTTGGVPGNSYGSNAKYEIRVYTGAKCEGDHAVVANPNNYAVVYKLDGSGNYCVGDQ